MQKAIAESKRAIVLAEHKHPHFGIDKLFPA